MKYLSPGEAETKRHQAIEFLHRIGKHDEAEQFEAMPPQEYAEHKERNFSRTQIQIIGEEIIWHRLLRARMSFRRNWTKLRITLKNLKASWTISLELLLMKMKTRIGMKMKKKITTWINGRAVLLNRDRRSIA